MQNKSTNMFIMLLLLIIHQFGMVLNQNQDTSIGVAKCRGYKKSIFEKEHTFSYLVFGAPERKVTVDHCKQYGPFIVGGEPAGPKEFPHIARLGRRNDRINHTNWFCGGTLINDRFVLTAAHCFASEYGEVNVVRLGELDFSRNDDDARPQDYAVRQYIEHPSYTAEINYNDIGLIELNEKVVFDFYKHPACLPIAKGDGDAYKELLAIGWGSIRFTDVNSDKLLKVKLDRFTADFCDKHIDDSRFPNGWNDTIQLCVGSDLARDTCNGDSGGPLLSYHPDFPCLYFVMGITSGGLGGCGTPNIPGIYTRVYPYLNWINQIVWKN